jgi:hypothetical protein
MGMDEKLQDEEARVAALVRCQIADSGEEDQFVQITNWRRADHLQGCLMSEPIHLFGAVAVRPAVLPVGSGR